MCLAKSIVEALVCDESLSVKEFGSKAYTICGDSMKVMQGFPDDSIDCVITDPPYFLSSGGITCVSGRMVSVNKGSWDDAITLTELQYFNRKWMSEVHRVLKPGGSIWVSGTLHNYFSLGMVLRELGFKVLNDIVWEKPAPPPNLSCRTFTHSSELLIWAAKLDKTGKHKYTFNYRKMREMNGGKQMKNIWKISPPRKVEKIHGKHPTQKPIALIERCVLAATNEGELILDLFAGSHTTGVVALRHQREYIGIEQELEYDSIGSLRLQSELDRNGEST